MHSCSRLQPRRQREMRKTQCEIQVARFVFNTSSPTQLIMCPSCASSQTLIFSLFPLVTAKTCSGGLVLFGSSGWKVLTPNSKINMCRGVPPGKWGNLLDPSLRINLNYNLKIITYHLIINFFQADLRRRPPQTPLRCVELL
jgi:hypothetical protein